MEEDFYITLLYKKLTDEIAEHELKILEEWLHTSEKNRQLARDVEITWKESVNLRPVFTVDVNREYEKLAQRIQADQKGKQQEKTKVRSLRTYWYAAAACIVVLLAVGYAMRNTLFNAGDGYATVSTTEILKEVLLADGSKVTLNKHSVLTYPTTFDEEERKVRVSGEAFFDVKRHPSTPFKVETSQTEIQVLGTSFNVKEDASKGKVEVHVATGKVQFKSKDNDYQKLELSKGETGVYHSDQQLLAIDAHASPNTIAWITKNLHFVNVPIKTVLPQLESLYGIQIELANPALKECLFTGIFENLSVYQSLETISVVLGMEIEQIGTKHYRLKGGGCE